MSCVKCEQAIRETPGTEIGLSEDMTQPLPVHYTYVRVGAANVLISGCKTHLAELLRIYRLGLGMDREL
jgi:hypothetical protein